MIEPRSTNLDSDRTPRRAQIDAARRQADATDAARTGSNSFDALDFNTPHAGDPRPDAIPGYRIVGKIGRGGQAVVLRAVELATDKPVAIKVLRRGVLADPRDRLRFEREIDILHHLNHENIVAIRERGSPSGELYFVMDLIEGITLDRWIVEQFAGDTRPAVDDVLRIVIQICDAVNAAHRAGVIHRDLKPANIVIDPSGRPKVLDFGLAKLSRRSDESDASGEHGGFVGSLPWAAPEQLSDTAQDADVRVDVFSLGVVLFQMLTGKLPFGTRNELSGDEGDPIDELPAASALRGDLNDDVDKIVLTCLRKDPDRRYQNAGELARDLTRYLTAQPIDARRNEGWYVLKKTLRQEKVPVAAAAALLIDSVLNDYNEYRADTSPFRLANAARVVKFATVTVAALTLAGLIATATAAGDLIGGIEACFEVLFAGAFVYAVPAIIGIMLLRPPRPRSDTPIAWRKPGRLLWLAVGITIVAVLLLLYLNEITSNVISVLWAVAPAVVMLRGIEQLMQRLPNAKLVRLARFECRGAIMFGFAATVVLVYRSAGASYPNYEAAWLALMLGTLLAGLALGVGGLVLLHRVHNTLVQARV